LAQDRTIILHYHLFKNAGTSVDAILKQNFPGRWVTREFPTGSGNNTAQVESWIRETPDAVAFSSHTMIGPVPRVEGVRIISFLLLRDPIERIRSAYRFEKGQASDTWGAQLAKEHDFEGYVRARLSRPGDRQCRDFQTHRLASMAPGRMPPRDAALSALETVTVAGVVERFEDAVARLGLEIRKHYPHFSATAVRANVSATGETQLADDVAALLRSANQDDIFIHKYLSGEAAKT
jgi:hypothetical protein